MHLVKNTFFIGKIFSFEKTEAILYYVKMIILITMVTESVAFFRLFRLPKV